MARGYRFNKPKQENFDGEDIDRLFYGDHKVTIFDNPNYEEGRTGYQKLERFDNKKRSRSECGCGYGCGGDKDIEFWRNVSLILLAALVLRMLLDSGRK